jgi:hypothetical protein
MLRSAGYHLLKCMEKYSALIISAEHILQFLELFCAFGDISALNNSVL